MPNKWNIPKLHISIEPNGGDEPRYRWSVTLIMPDAVGGRCLGYRRSGGMRADLITLAYDAPVAVHDDDRDVWTAMNPTDRPDVQKKIDQLVRDAAAKMANGGQQQFEYKISDS